MSRPHCAYPAILAGLLSVGVSSAQLGLDLGHPLLTFDSQGTTTFDAATGVLTIDATPIAVQFTEGQPPRFVTPSGDPPQAFVTLSIVVDATGQLVSGVPGDDLIVFGQVDEDGDGTPDYSQVLLAGEVADFGFNDNAPEAPLPKASRGRATSLIYKAAQNGSMIAGNFLSTDEYELQFDATGGSLLSLYNGQDIGVELVSEQSTFEGDWTMDFEGEAKGNIGPVPPMDDPGACCLETGECVFITEPQCLAENGTFQGEGVTCESLGTYTYMREFGFGESQNNSAGNVDKFSTTYNPSTQRMTLEVTFSPKDGNLPNGFTHVVNCGPNPKNHPGELAIFYFDASDTGPWPDGPVLTVYAYNGATNSPNDSWKDGDGEGSNDPDFDLIEASGFDDSFVYAFIDQDNPDGTRTLGFDIDVSAINAHVPAFPAPDGSEWKGAAFDTGIGYWFHPFNFENLDYEDDLGFIEKIEVNKQGWLDFANETAELESDCVPTIGACCLLTGDCIELGESACLAQGGEFQGQGVGCDELDIFVYMREFGYGEAQNNDAGNVDKMTMVFDPLTNRLLLEATFSPKDGKLPDGFTQVINNGPNPKNHPGELAIFYYDASGTGPGDDPILTVYGYNGSTGSPNDSWEDGDGAGSNDPDPDVIEASLIDDSFIYELINRDNGDGTITLGFDIDATTINNHTPAFPAPDGSPWTGAQFDTGIGYWFHPFRFDEVDYDNDGLIEDIDIKKKGWLDIANDTADGSEGCVPGIGACCLPTGCVELSEEACVAEGGLYQGDGAMCEDFAVYAFSRNFSAAEQNPGAGLVKNVNAFYSPSAERLMWQVSYAESPEGNLPDTFSIVINDGASPYKHGVFAVVYFDATAPDPIVTVYAYNGNNPKSYKDGDNDPSNDPNPDCIASSLIDASFIYEASVENMPGMRTFVLDIDASGINAHTPMFPADDGTPWYGAAFNENIGYWLHSFLMDPPIYNAGKLVTWPFTKQGFVDVFGEPTDLFGCLAAPQMVLHYDFAGVTGNLVEDRVGQVDLELIEDGGDIELVADTYGACVLFDQPVNGKCCAVTASPLSTEYLRQALMATDALTVQVFFKQTDDHDNGSRILSWSQGTNVNDRNFSVIGVDGPNTFDNWTRLRTTGGTYNDGPTNAWSNNVPTVYTMTYDANTDQKVRVYLNGELAWTDDTAGGTLDNWLPYNLMLGNESTLNRAFQGAIYDVKIWDGRLTDTEIEANASTLLNPPDWATGQ